MKLYISCPSFNSLLINIIPESLGFGGCIDGYGYKDEKSFNWIRFTLDPAYDVPLVIELIKTKFSLNTEVCKIDDYLVVKDSRVQIKTRSGSQGYADGISFYFQKD